MAPSEERPMSVPQLIEQKNSTPVAKLDAFKSALKALSSLSVQELLSKLAQIDDPLLLWAIHLRLARLDVPPCLRWPKRADTPQEAYITWLADVFWFTKRNATHQPFFKRWSGLFTNQPGSNKWHAVAHWAYNCGHQASHYRAMGLGLSDADRQPLMTMVSKSMRRDRAVLQRLPALRDRIWLHAMDHPDRSGSHTPSEIADRRATLLRMYLLAGRNRTLAANLHRCLTGKTISRQSITRHLEAIEVATGMRSL